MKRTLLISLAVGNLVIAGCGFNRLVLTETSINPTNGFVTTKSMHITTQDLWPAKTTIDKQRASIGKTLSAGSTGIDNDSGSTNIADVIRATTGLMDSIGKLSRP